MKLEGKVALITGGASGIGRATALKFAREGARVVIADLSEDGAEAVRREITASGGEASALRTNVAVFEDVQSAVNHAVERFGNLHIVFNNAGTGHFAPLLQHEPQDYDRVVKVNQYGVYYGILAGARTMVELGTRGVIINTASVFAFLASHGVFGYHAAKGAVVMMTKAAALELAPHGIRVVAVAPGGVDTPIIQGYKDMGLGEAMGRQQMRGALQTPEQIANAVTLLALDEADAINGSVVMTDDGHASFK